MRIQSLQHLEPRRLLAFDYSLIDLGVVNQALGSAVLDLNDQGFVLTAEAVWSIHSGKGRKDYIDTSFLPIKLGTNVTVAGTFVSTHQAGSVRHKEPRALRTSSIGPLPLTNASSANALGPKDSAVGRMKGSGAYHAFFARYQGPSTFATTDLTEELAGRGLEINNAIDISGSNQILLSGVDSQSDLPGAAIVSLTSRGLQYLQLAGDGGANEQILPRELNDIGQAAGVIQDQSGSSAVLWTTSRHGVSVTTLPTLGGTKSAARGLNNFGLVVGFSTTASGKQRATLYDRLTGQTTDLNTLADTFGMTLRLATSVNNLGQIAAEATDAQGLVHAVVLLPTQPYPAPTPGISLGAGGNVLVNGTRNRDNITIKQDTQDPTRIAISLNGKTQSYNIVDIRGVQAHGGAGDDSIVLDAPTAYLGFTLSGDHGDDVITASSSVSNFQNTISGGEGNDRITTSGSQGNYLASGDGGNDTLISLSGHDTLRGGAGDDLLQAQSDAALFQGESGNDTILGGAGNDIVVDGSGDDSIVSGAGDDRITCSQGNDFVDAGDGADNIFGGAGDDCILGGNGNDIIYGDEGNDTLLGQAGNDTLAGDIAVTRDTLNDVHDPGDDLLNGGRGRDYLLGSTDLDAGIDTLIGGTQGDLINGRSSDLLPDAGSDDIVPRAQTAGTSPFAVDQTATIILNFPARYPARFPRDHVRSSVTVPAGAGDFSGSPFFAESDDVLRMRSHLNRDFTLGEFFDNWGIYVDATHFGGYVSPYASSKHRTVITVNGQPFSRDRVVQSGETLTIDVEL